MKTHPAIRPASRRTDRGPKVDQPDRLGEPLVAPGTAQLHGLDDLAPSLNRLSGERCWELFRKLLERNLIEDAELQDVAPISPEGEDVVLITIAAGCRIGAFRCEESIWEITSGIG